MAINFNQIADDFRRTNWKDPGTWSMLPMILVLAVILAVIPVAGYFLVWDPQYRSEERRVGKECRL